METSTCERIKKRFDKLYFDSNKIHIIERDEDDEYVSEGEWHTWSTNVLHLFKISFGENSVHYKQFEKLCDKQYSFYPSNLNSAIGVFLAAKSDFEDGYMFSIETAISGELFGDFVNLAKKSLDEGHKDVAAVLACASLEDALKRYAYNNGVDVNEKPMEDIVNALKAKGLVSGSQKTILDTMPKIRNSAMHADWDKITKEAVGSVIGFVVGCPKRLKITPNSCPVFGPREIFLSPDAADAKAENLEVQKPGKLSEPI